MQSKRGILLPGITVLAGIMGFFLRQRELADALISERGLSAPGMVSFVLLGLSALLLLTLVLGSLRIAFAGGYTEAFSTPSPLFPAVSALTAALVAAAGVLSFREFFTFLSANGAAGLSKPGNPLISRGVLGVAALLCCIALAGQSLRMLGRGKRAGKYSLAVLAPAFLCCVWLFGVYQSKAADPILLDYIYTLAGVMACALAGYFMAGFMYEKPKPRTLTVFGLLAVYLCGVCLAETGDTIGRLLFIGMGLYYLAAVIVFLHNARPAARAVTKPKMTEEVPDEE